MNLKISTTNFNFKHISFKKGENPRTQNVNSKFEKSLQKDSFELTVGYVNDTHGQTNNMMRILSGINADLKLSAGDNDIGDEKNKAIHNATIKFLNITSFFIADADNVDPPKKSIASINERPKL